MKGDFSRSTFVPKKHYRDVRLQQGRVSLDADFNEYVDITAHRVETETVDVIGHCGAPVHDAGFQLAAAVADLPPEQQAAATALGPLGAGDFYVSAGRYYVDGILCENDSPIFFSSQKNGDLPDADVLTATGLYLAYLEVWPRHLTFLDDSLLREVALGGPDSATRNKTVWQLRLIKAGKAGDAPDCGGTFPDFETRKAQPTGRLSAQTEPDQTSDKPCIIAPGAGYRRLENQLYRVEIHARGADGAATFKWSRDNGAVVAKWKLTVDVAVIELQRPPPDEKLNFAIGQWVEITDDRRELLRQPGMLVKLADVKGKLLTLAAPLPELLASFTANPKVRRWDGAGDLVKGTGDVTVKAGQLLALEDGVQVKFTAGTYETGDYWLIPARTAAGDVEWPTDGGVPMALPPSGVSHHCCAVGFVDFNGQKITPHNCGPFFPPLTEIKPGGDLKLHNQHLHGWGVVCGLQVHCAGGDGTNVRVEPGHAIACDGTDILNASAKSFPLVATAKQKGLLNPDKPTELFLTLGYDAQAKPTFDLAPATPEATLLQAILNGTLLKDVYDDCLKPLVEFAQKQFTKADPNDPKLVPMTKRRLTAALNLAVQFANADVGHRVWLSRDEHDMLADLLAGFQKFVGSKTFCGLARNRIPFPDYPFDETPVRTAFGKTAMSGVRLHPDGSRAYAFDAEATGKLYVFDLKTGEMIRETPIPAAADATLTIQDGAFFESAHGPRLLLAATDATKTVLAVYDPGANAFEFTREFPGKQVTALATPASPNVARGVLAVAKSEGIYLLDPTSSTSLNIHTPSLKFNAAGHLALLHNVVAATVATAPGASTYSAVQFGSLDAGIHPGRLAPLKLPNNVDGVGEDGLALVINRSNHDQTECYVAVAPTTTPAAKSLLVINPFVDSSNPALLPLPTDSGAVSLAPVFENRFLAVTAAQSAQVFWLDPRFKLVNVDQWLPAQISPAAAEAGASRDGLLVVTNRVSQTLSLVPLKHVGVTPAVVPFDAFVKYRDEVAAAYRTLFLRLLQTLKDCLCEHLLVDCPTCAKDDVVVLARVTVRDGKVYHICNFARREVLTFPKVKYWLSAVPVIPLLTWVIEKLCCGIVPGLEPRDQASPERRTNFLSTANTASLAGRIAAMNFSFGAKAMTERLSLLTRHFTNVVADRALFAAPAKPGAAVRPAEIVNVPPTAAASRLADKGVAVTSIADYDLSLAQGAAVFDASYVPADLKAGDKVTLYVRGNKVVFYTRETPMAVAGPPATPGTPTRPVVPITPVRPLTPVTPSVVPFVPGRTIAGPEHTSAPVESDNPEAIRLQAELGVLRSQVFDLQRAHSEALSSRDREIASLLASTQKLRTDFETSKRRTATQKGKSARPPAPRSSRKKPPKRPKR